MREKPKFKNAIRKHYRITPAYAGKTFKEWICNNNTAGSPPRMREKQRYARVHLRQSRITPAYAGKTTLQEIMTTQAWDHPRVCGKNTKRSQ